MARGIRFDIKQIKNGKINGHDYYITSEKIYHRKQGKVNKVYAVLFHKNKRSLASSAYIKKDFDSLQKAKRYIEYLKLKYKK